MSSPKEAVSVAVPSWSPFTQPSEETVAAVGLSIFQTRLIPVSTSP
ncbi:MAG: hypothetical protein MPW13_19280 [Candidatus Manganitrophus sp.]|nr:hypothetical protein [Candidatus Manganitrophus sp.]